MDIYFSTLRRWSRHVFREPHNVMFLSLIFFLLSIPIVTFGIAFVTCLYMAKLDSEGKKYKLKDILKTKIKPIFVKSLIMGVLDICLFLISLLCLYMLYRNRIPIGLKIIYELYLGIDFVYLISSMYRYPMLVCNESIGLTEIFARGMLITFKNLFVCILFTMVVLTILIVSILTGVGIILIFPGAVSLLYIYIYKQSLEFYEVTG